MGRGLSTGHPDIMTTHLIRSRPPAEKLRRISSVIIEKRALNNFNLGPSRFPFHQCKNMIINGIVKGYVSRSLSTTDAAVSAHRRLQGDFLLNPDPTGWLYATTGDVPHHYPPDLLAKTSRQIMNPDVKLKGFYGNRYG